MKIKKMINIVIVSALISIGVTGNTVSCVAAKTNHDITSEYLATAATVYKTSVTVSVKTFESETEEKPDGDESTSEFDLDNSQIAALSGQSFLLPSYWEEKEGETNTYSIPDSGEAEFSYKTFGAYGETVDKLIDSIDMNKYLIADQCEIVSYTPVQVDDRDALYIFFKGELNGKPANGSCVYIYGYSNDLAKRYRLIQTDDCERNHTEEFNNVLYSIKDGDYWYRYEESRADNIEGLRNAKVSENGNYLVTYGDIQSGTFFGKTCELDAIVGEIDEQTLKYDHLKMSNFYLWFAADNSFVSKKAMINDRHFSDDMVEQFKSLQPGDVIRMTLNAEDWFNIDMVKSFEVIDRVNIETEIYDKLFQNTPFFNYEDVLRYPDNYNGVPTAFSGTIFQIVEGNKMLINTDAGLVYVDWQSVNKTNHFLENDYVMVYGEVHGRLEYDSLIQKNVVPRVMATVVEFAG